MDDSTLPFNLALEAAVEERGWSVRELARQCRKRTGWGSQQSIWAYQRGFTPPTIEGMENIAFTLGINPRYFAEYRLLRARRELDPRHVGLARALATLAEHPDLGR